MPIWLNELSLVLGIIGSLVTIAGIPITIYQILSVKNKLETTKNALPQTVRGGIV